MGNIFQGLTTNWGFSVADIWTSGMGIVGSLAPFILLGIVTLFAPNIIWLVRMAILSKGKMSGADAKAEFMSPPKNWWR